MEKITLNGKLYIGLGDFDNLRRNLIRDIYDRYERDENGKMNLSERDAGEVAAYAHIMTKVMEDELRACETPNEVRALHERLRKEWMHDKYVIVGNDNGQNVFFRKMCGAMNDDGDKQPVFCSKIRLANTYDDHFAATTMAWYLSQNWDLEVKVEPLYLFAMTNEDAKKLLHAIFDDKDEPEYHGDGVKAEDEDWDGEDA